LTAAVAHDSTHDAAIDLRGLGPAELRRLAEILAVLARHGVIVVARYGTTIAIRPRDSGGRALAVALRRSFADLGPTFMKLGQLIASSPGIFPSRLSDECRRLLDDAPPVPAVTVRAALARELGAPIEVIFEDFDVEPIAAASIAQVHEATLRDGRRVAVKLRRPRLRARVDRDIRLLYQLARALDHAGSLGRSANPVAIVEDFAGTLHAELDLRLEARAMTDFAASLDGSPERDRVVVPAPVGGLVTERVLVMDFVDGAPIDDVDRHRHHDLEGVLRTAVRVWLEGVLIHGLFHGDVHAGNLFVTSDGRVAFLDFGITGRVAPQTRATLAALLPALLVSGDFGAAVDALFDLGAATGPIDREAAARDIERVVTPLLGQALGDIGFGEVLDQIIRVATRHRVRLPREMVLVVKQLLYFERYAKSIAPDHQILSDPALLAIVARAG